VREFWLIDMFDMDWKMVFRHLPLLQILHTSSSVPTIFILMALVPKNDEPVPCPHLKELYISESYKTWFPGQLLCFVKARKEGDAALGKLQLYASRALKVTEANELKLWVGKLVVKSRRASFGMDIPEKFTEYRHAYWFPRSPSRLGSFRSF